MANSRCLIRFQALSYACYLFLPLCDSLWGYWRTRVLAWVTATCVPNQPRAHTRTDLMDTFRTILKPSSSFISSFSSLSPWDGKLPIWSATNTYPGITWYVSHFFAGLTFWRRIPSHPISLESRTLTLSHCWLLPCFSCSGKRDTQAPSNVFSSFDTQWSSTSL